MINVGGVEVGGEVGGGFLTGANVGEPGLFEQPIFVAAASPAGEVEDGEMFAGVAKAFNDSGVGKAVLNHEVDFVAKGFWQPGDFAVVTPVQRGIFDF